MKWTLRATLLSDPIIKTFLHEAYVDWVKKLLFRADKISQRSGFGLLAVLCPPLDQGVHEN